MKRRHILLILLPIPILLFFGLLRSYYGSRAIPPGLTVTIPAGASAEQIGEILDREGLISSKTLFLLAVRVQKIQSRFRPGTYRFPSPISMADLIAALQSTRHQISTFVTISEGLRSWEIAALLREKRGIDSAAFLREVRDREFARSLGIDAPSLEGYLMPDTYAIPEKEPARRIVRMLVENFRKRADAEMREGMRRLNRSEESLLIIASLVEGETPNPDERARIAGVYYNRLRRGMRLQADPTIQYILGGAPRRLYFKDLERDSPYNTYVHAGLPPTPVNNPGMASIRAACSPEQNEFLYFVADGTGRHTFSRTEQQHLAAVERYRATREGSP